MEPITKQFKTSTEKYDALRSGLAQEYEVLSEVSDSNCEQNRTFDEQIIFAYKGTVVEINAGTQQFNKNVSYSIYIEPMHEQSNPQLVMNELEQRLL
jgi:hypothetical protein